MNIHLNTLKFNKYILENFSSWSIIEIKGDDALSFLQGQITQDLNKLKNDNSKFILAARTSRTGKLQSYFYIRKKSSSFLEIFIENKMGEDLIQDLESFIISEDVRFIFLKKSLLLIVGGDSNKTEYDKLGSRLELFNVPSILVENENDLTEIMSEKDVTLDGEDEADKFLEELNLLSKFPNVLKLKKLDDFIFNFPSMIPSVNLNKGCFIGFETISKVLTRRESIFDFLFIELDKIEPENLNEEIGAKVICDEQVIGTLVRTLSNEGSFYALVKIKKEFLPKIKCSHFFQIDGQKFKTKSIINHFFNFNDKTVFSRELYDLALNEFNKLENILEAKRLLELSIRYSNKNEEAYEMLAVILGKENNYEEGILLLENLLKFSPQSKMALVNLSLFHAALGHIDEAERYKALGVEREFKGGSSVGESEKEEDEAITMFKEIISLDENDVFAHSSLAKIYFKKKLENESLYHANQVLKLEPENREMKKISISLKHLK